MDDSMERIWRSRQGLVRLDLVPKWMLQVARGLTFLHECNVVHSDLSLANILVTRTDEVRICDVGMACLAGSELLAAEAKATPYVRAPELIFGLSHVTPAVDVWSYGVDLLCLLTGTRLFSPGALGPDCLGHEQVLRLQVAVLGLVPSFGGLADAAQFEALKGLAAGASECGASGILGQSGTGEAPNHRCREPRVQVGLRMSAVGLCQQTTCIPIDWLELPVWA